MTRKLYCEPSNCGLASTDRAIRNAVSSGTFPIDDGENPQSQS